MPSVTRTSLRMPSVNRILLAPRMPFATRIRAVTQTPSVTRIKSMTRIRASLHRWAAASCIRGVPAQASDSDTSNPSRMFWLPGRWRRRRRYRRGWRGRRGGAAVRIPSLVPSVASLCHLTSPLPQSPPSVTSLVPSLSRLPQSPPSVASLNLARRRRGGAAVAVAGELSRSCCLLKFAPPNIPLASCSIEKHRPPNIPVASRNPLVGSLYSYNRSTLHINSCVASRNPLVGFPSCVARRRRPGDSLAPTMRRLGRERGADSDTEASVAPTRIRGRWWRCRRVGTRCKTRWTCIASWVSVNVRQEAYIHSRDARLGGGRQATTTPHRP